MKLVFVAGMQHSGTTLTDHLLSQIPNVVGLGEVAAFFSPEHMAHNARRWSGLEGRGHCSCGASWANCAFWGPLMPHFGLNSNAPMLDKYRALFLHARACYGDDVVLVDSSKLPAVLQFLADNREALGLGRDDLRVMVTVKDVRCFTKSIACKRGASNSWLAKARSFNWWLSTHRNLLAQVERVRVPFRINLYERMCADSKGFTDRTVEWLGGVSAGIAADDHGRSHIAIGNKDFVLRNRDRVTYDFRWYLDDAINWIYLLHWRARAFNVQLYALTDTVPVRKPTSGE